MSNLLAVVIGSVNRRYRLKYHHSKFQKAYLYTAKSGEPLSKLACVLSLRMLLANQGDSPPLFLADSERGSRHCSRKSNLPYSNQSKKSASNINTPMLRLGRSKSFRDPDEELVLRLNLNGIRDRRKHRQQKEEVGRRSKSSSRSRPLSALRHHVYGENRQDDASSIASKWSRASSRRSSARRNDDMTTDPDHRDQYSLESTSNSFDHNSLSSNFTGKKSNKGGEKQAIKQLIIEDLWSDHPAVVEKGLKKLSGIVGMKNSETNAKANREIIFRAGGHLAIVQAMKKHKNSEAVQREGCRALGIAAEEIIETSNENAIATVGGIDAILSAMRHFRSNEQVQDFGCGALQNLTGVDENARIMAEKDGLAILMMSMRTFPKSVNVQESACWTVVNLCLRKENKSKIEKARCLSTVASVIDNHPRNPQLKVAAQEAIQHLLSLLAPAPENQS